MVKLVSANLTPGNHTIEWAMEGYESITATINVSPTGILSCIGVIGGLCADLISIVGTTITGLMNQIIPAENICYWISNIGGWDNLNWTNHVLKAYYVYLGAPGYLIEYSPVTWNSVLGLYYYYIGSKEMGNSKTGCNF